MDYGYIRNRLEKVSEISKLTHVVGALVGHNVDSLGDVGVLVLIVDTLEPAVVGQHFLTVCLFSCNTGVVVALNRVLTRFEI